MTSLKDALKQNDNFIMKLNAELDSLRTEHEKNTVLVCEKDQRI
jgi:hypothetical protein